MWRASTRHTIAEEQNQRSNLEKKKKNRNRMKGIGYKPYAVWMRINHIKPIERDQMNLTKHKTHILYQTVS